jgi:hypothetical protein
MSKPLSKYGTEFVWAGERGIEIWMTVDWDDGLVDLEVYASRPKKGREQVVGTVNLRMEDLRQVVPLLTEPLQIENQLVKPRQSKGRKRANS